MAIGRRRDGRRGALKGLPVWGFVMLILAWWMQQPPYSQAQSSSPEPSAAAECPFNFTAVSAEDANLVNAAGNVEDKCAIANSGLDVVAALYIRQTNFFLVPAGSEEPCRTAFQSRLDALGVMNFNFSASCTSPFLSERGTDNCHNIQTSEDMKDAIGPTQLAELNSSCFTVLSTGTTCSNCNIAIFATMIVLDAYDGGDNNTSCKDYVTVFTLGVVNIEGPLDPGAITCFLFILLHNSGKANNKYVKFIGVGVGGMLLVSLVLALILYWRYRHVIAAKRKARRKRTKDMLCQSSVPTASVNWFTMQELKRATGNFHRDNILGTGGFGNVYKGTLPDGSIVAVKRFKNCAPAGDADFVHEVEMISSVRHRHLVAIRGCCVDSSEQLGGHQRIIVYDYMPNGSLADHLFPKPFSTNHIFLDWPTRSKIAIGMARGLAYLHHDALPAIFHRDIKPSNILLDTDFNARLADFGLAKFTPEGVSHLTTRAAGTFGYVSPEYALYGQLTEKSDVYSFGMVVLELISGRKALTTTADDCILLSEWAWPLAKEGQWRSVIDPKLIGNVEADDVMERFILVALLCAHPQLFYRPSIDQALRMLESSTLDVPPVPDRPLPLTSNEAQIHEALLRESDESREFSSKTGYTSYYSMSHSGVSTSLQFERR